jgi:uncharacterized membrane protein
MKGSFSKWRGNFLTGLAVVLPAIISIALLVWLFDVVSNITDTLLIFLPRSWTHERGGEGPMYWHYSLLALLVAVALISLVGRLARYYLGKKLIQAVDLLMSRVPLLNKVYGTIKQVNEAFSSSKKSAFKQVVLVQFPCPGIYSIGFITSEEHREVEAKTGEKMVGVFIPTTPNPTTGFLVVLRDREVTRLDMSVADGIKFVVSLGAIVPDYAGKTGPPPGLPTAPSSTAATA